MRFSLPGLALSRPVTVVMLSICMLALGIISWTRIPLQFLPEWSPPFINCRILYPGATPEQVEEEVTIPAEGEFRTIPGVTRIFSISDSEGSFVHMVFGLDMDMTQATAEVRDRIERLKLKLPDEVDTILIERFSSSSIPIVAMALLTEGDEEQLVHRVRTVLEPRLRRIDGVADVFIRTTRPETEVLIELTQDMLRAMNLSLYELVGALRASSLNVPLGDLQVGGQKHYVRAVAEYRDLDDIRDIIIAPNGMRLGEIATVRHWTRDPEWFATIDGKGGAFVMAIKESEANTVATCRAVRRVLDDLEGDPLFEGAVHFVFFDQSELILSALGNLRDAGIYGGVMALIVLFMFLHRFRPTVIVALAIPTSLMVALVVMFFANMSMNMISMVSMIIAIGLLVDNSIVVVENIIRHRRQGYSALESAKRGALEVGLAVTAATSTTWVVFLPLFFMEMGRMRVFTRELAIPLTVAIGGSLLIALTLIPLAMSRMRERHENPWLQRISNLQESRFGIVRLFMRVSPVQAVITANSWLLRVALRWRLAAFLLLAGLLAITYQIPFQHVGMKDMPKMDTRRIDVRLNFDQNFSLDMIEERFGIIEGIVEERREMFGIKNVFKFYNTERGKLEVYLFTQDDGPEWVSPEYRTDDVLAELAAFLPEQMPGISLIMEVAEAGESDDDVGLRVQLRGDNAQRLRTFAEQFMVYMKRIPDIQSVELDLAHEKQEMRLHIDEDLAARAGISPLAVAQTVDAALRGARMPYLKQGGREIPVWLQFREEDRKSKENLETITLFGEGDTALPLSQLVEYSKAPSPAAIRRVNGKNVVTIIARTSSDKLSFLRAEILRAVESFDLPPGYTVELGRGLEELGENMMNFSQALIMAVILIYLVMCALFESYILPLSILTTVPISFVGVYWMFYLTGTNMEIVTLIGCILMVGLIVNNGIVIVDHINLLRSRGVARDIAIVQAGSDRFRPVMMTAFTTILGCVPLAIAASGGAMTFRGLGRAIIGGMSVGTLLTLIIVPLIYATLDDVSLWLRGFLGSFSPRATRRAGQSEIKG